ncbi:MAG: hypothetical protein HY037_05300 [Nitrospirae bacterium]|nr:hypothetical protein [Candidatus Troglogloeales bacterium]
MNNPVIVDELEQSWSKALAESGIESAALLSCSYDPARRTYADNKNIYKIILLHYETTSKLRAQDFQGEFMILKDCAGILGIPVAIECRRNGDFEILVLERIYGEPLDRLKIGLFQLFVIMIKLGVILFRLARKGISHNDIKAENVLKLSDGGVALVDFDQAVRVGFFESILRSFLGINKGGARVHYSVTVLLKDYLKKNLPPKTVTLLKRMTGKDLSRKHRLPSIPGDASPQLVALYKAWQLAQESDASSPGGMVAYYAFNFYGYRFPGERPWEERWTVLKKITDYSGKRVLELGCNMSLLSCFLLKEGGASAALAVDVDNKILGSAKLVATALGIAPSFTKQNLDDLDDWETTLSNFKPDIVFALNVLNWVKDKQRLLNFLGRFDEVIFEGHDAVETETERLSNIGFKQIRLIATSERKRPIMHCHK